MISSEYSKIEIPFSLVHNTVLYALNSKSDPEKAEEDSDVILTFRYERKRVAVSCANISWENLEKKRSSRSCETSTVLWLT